MDLNFTSEQEAFRKEARSWLEANVPSAPLASFDSPEGFEEHREWELKLNAGGWAMVPWPKEYGGRGANLLEWLIFEEEYYRAGAPGRVNQNGIFLLGPTIMEYGTPEQKARFLPKMASSEEVWAQGWSEPNAGSDMANIQATAILEGDEYIINGQKTWASRGAYAHWLFGMFRTDPESTRHHGLTFILAPLDAPGITVRPIDKLSGKPAFAEVFFDDARVAAEHRLGPAGEGWNVAMATAGFERGLMLRSPARFQNTARKLVDLYRETETQGVYIDPAIRNTVARCWMDAEAYTLNTYQTVSRLLAGGKIGAEASLNKIFWSELDLKMHETALELLGARGELLPGSPGAGDVGEWLDGYIFALAGPIYAGTNEVQRNIIAERILGLPRKQGTPVMEFNFTEDQSLLQQTVRDFLEGECTVEHIRAMWENETGRSPEFWRKLAEIGVPGLLVPEEQGGLGMDETDMVLVLEETGRAGTAEPVIHTAVVGARLLAEAGNEALANEWLPKLAEGGAIVAVDHGQSPFVSDAHIADLLILNSLQEVHAVPAAQVTLTAEKANDPAKKLFNVEWTPSPDTLIAEGGAGIALQASAFDRGAFACAAQLLGVTDKLIEMAVEYGTQRKQFGVPIGSFQAVKHMLANEKVKLEYARTLVYRAAHSVACGVPSRGVDVSMAKIATSEVAISTAKTALQVHGALGYTWEQDLHVWMRRAWSLDGAWGNAAFHRARLADAVIDREQPAESFGYSAPAA